MKTGILIIIIIVGIVLLFYFVVQFKRFKITAVNMITGAVKTGKSAFSLVLARHTYKNQVLKWRITSFFNTIFNLLNKEQKEIEKPLFYSNIPVGFEYVELNEDLLLRKQRFNYKSVVFIDEISLIADNYDFKDLDFNENIKMFFKLFGHETKGGYCFINTQNIEDNHFIVKRSITQYLYIHHKIRLPFFSIVFVREMSNTENTTNVVTTDLEDNLKWLVFGNSIFKKYDCYCYSILTDALNTIRQTKRVKSLKSHNILSFKNRSRHQ